MGHILGVDIETFSPVDLKSCGSAKYVEHPRFRGLIVAFHIDDSPVYSFHLCPEMPDFNSAKNRGNYDVFIRYLNDPTVLKFAYNAPFERRGLAKIFGRSMPASEWVCTMATAGMLGYPMGLDKTAKALNLTVQKDPRGQKLMRMFSIPDKDGNVVSPASAIPEFFDYMAYCERDVMVEREVRKALFKLLNQVTVPATERELWVLDQEINDRGVPINVELVDSAIEMYEVHVENLLKEAQILGVENAQSPAQVKKWLNDSANLEEEISSLNKAALDDLKVLCKDDKTASRLIEIRSQLSKSSVKKFKALQNWACFDGWVRGMIQIYGADQTGRFAGRGPQPQNFVKNVLGEEALERCIQLIKSRNTAAIELLFGPLMHIISQICRTAFIPPPGCHLAAPDYSAIEARVLAWIAGEQWRLDVFNGSGKIYETSASRMYHVPIEQITKGSTFRLKGKLSELALGYQGAGGALTRIAQSALTEALLKYALLGEHPKLEPGETPIQGIVRSLTLSDEELKTIPRIWRDASPAIVSHWRNMEECALMITRDRGGMARYHAAEFSFKNGSLVMRLPSGRSIFYHGAQIGQNDFGECVTFWALNSKNQWVKEDTYGGKLTENITQAISRDVLVDGMLRLKRELPQYPILFHVHDEIVAAVPEGHDGKDIDEVMKIAPSWAAGLPLKAETSILKFYRKE